jgi:hypothetical protein
MTPEERKIKQREYQKNYNARDPERRKEQQKRYRNSEKGKAKLQAWVKEHYWQNKEEINARCREYYAANKVSIIERNRWYKIARQFGLTREQWEERLAAQGFKCACCGADDPNARGGKGWVVDHCHRHGHVRGILCSHCNTGLGMANDDPAILKKWIAYLGG